MVGCWEWQDAFSEKISSNGRQVGGLCISCLLIVLCWLLQLGASVKGSIGLCCSATRNHLKEEKKETHFTMEKKRVEE